MLLSLVLSVALVATQPRTTCEEIRGTQYQYDEERVFFLANCIDKPIYLTGYKPPVSTTGNTRLERLKQCESSGNYRAINYAGPYYGAYQYIQSTWNYAAKKAGYNEWIGVNPINVPPAVQDAVTANLMATEPYHWKYCLSR